MVKFKLQKPSSLADASYHVSPSHSKFSNSSDLQMFPTDRFLCLKDSAVKGGYCYDPDIRDMSLGLRATSVALVTQT